MESHEQNHGPELWGGVECTINRVGDEYIEQLRRTGHVENFAADFERFAKLGIKALRQPILWECTQPDSTQAGNWRWAELALDALTRLGIRPIVGLLHHGSGPKCTNLLDPTFAIKFAEYAKNVALHFPEVQDYTPVNEPLTTARFSALYGHWYPHARDEHSFTRALLNQCRAVVLAMRAIREVNPSARLIQTDDLGKVHSSPSLAYQAEFENERRWSTFDLLCGRVDRSHRMWHHFRWAGIPEADLEWFVEHPCPPDVIGLNHYLSGERYLDDHLERYPDGTHGGNGTHRYADVPAARVLRSGTFGVDTLLMEAWKRYERPIAITECHNGCTREEQLRWFLATWRDAEKARSQGANVLAVTAWSLLGSFDWDTLVTQTNDRYEPGVFDVRSTPPRPTALVDVIQAVASHEQLTMPLLEVPGWWERPRRFVYGIMVDEMAKAEPAPAEFINRDYPTSKPLLITGGDEILSGGFVRMCELRGIPYRVLSRNEMDIANAASVSRALRTFEPWAMVNTADYVTIDLAEGEPSPCFRENTTGAQLLARECNKRRVRFLTLSSDMVFDGQKDSPYVETDIRAPLSVYGWSKAEAEELVQQAMPAALIVRSGPVFGPWDKSNFLSLALQALAKGAPFAALADVTVSPTYLPDLVDAALDLLIDNESGIWHLANQGQVTWADFAERAASISNISSRSLRQCRQEDLRLPAQRPSYSVLTSERAILLPSLEDALVRLFQEMKPIERELFSLAA